MFLAIKQLNYLCNECLKTGAKIYLFIDEYDHFTYKILAEPNCLDKYRHETHGEGYLRTFFDTIKAGTDSSIARVFVTGVSPVTLDDLTSGFNIGTNYTLCSQFNEMTGFTEPEVRDMLTYYSTQFEFNHTHRNGGLRGSDRRLNRKIKIRHIKVLRCKNCTSRLELVLKRLLFEQISCRHRIRYLAMVANIRNRGSITAQRVEYTFTDEHILPSAIHPILWLQGINLLDPLDGGSLFLSHVGSKKSLL